MASLSFSAYGVLRADGLLGRCGTSTWCTRTLGSVHGGLHHDWVRGSLSTGLQRGWSLERCKHSSGAHVICLSGSMRGGLS
jgi:hypothetical protein